MNQAVLKKIRNQMLSDGFSEYDAFGHVTPEATAIWNAEFQKRINNYGNK